MRLGNNLITDLNLGNNQVKQVRLGNNLVWEWSPSTLFSAGEQGVWYDPSDFARYMGQLGNELIPTLDFNSVDWGKTNIASQTTNTFTTNPSAGGVTEDILTVGKTYTVTISGSVTAGEFTVNTSDSLSNPSTRTQFMLGFGTITFVANNRFLYLRNSVSGSTTTVTSISVKEVTGISSCSLYQDSLGTSPVTAVGQPVGRILDRRISANSTILTDNCNSFAGWTNIIGVGSSVGGRIRITRPSDNNIGRASKPITCVVGNTYKITIERYNGTTSNTSTSVGIAISSSSIGGALLDSSTTAQGTYTAFFTATQTTHWLFLMTTTGANIGDYCEFDNIVITEQLGNHAIQSTAINRPILRQDLNGKYYLEANGTNTAMVTASNLNMSASDEVMVLAGVRKMATTDGTICELSASQVSNVGTFQLRSSLSGNPTYYLGSRGDASGAQAVITSSAYTAPISNVLTGQGDISAPLVKLRVNSGAEELINAISQGAGNYGSYLLYLFGRGGSAPYLNGRLYGLIIRGTNTADRVRARAERYMSGKTLLTATPMLDGISSASALSLRKIRSDYNGPAIRVRNSSTNVETDIGFAEDGWINQTTLLSATGVNSGFVTTIYDQSGNSRNATQTTASLQPRIVLNGVVDVQNGRPCILTATAQSGMSVTPTGLFKNVAGASISTVFRIQSGSMTNNASLVFASTGPNATSTRLALMLTPQGASADPTKIGIGIRRDDANSYFPLSGNVSTASLVGNTAISTIVMDYSTAKANQWINRTHDIVDATAQTPGLTSNTDPLSAVILSRGTTAVPLGTSISEVIFFNQALTNEQRIAIEDNQTANFNIL